MSRHIEVAVQFNELLVTETGLHARHRRLHGRQPSISGTLGDVKWCVAHAKSRMSALIGVRLRSSPVLLEEELEVTLGLGQIFGVHGPKLLVVLDLFIERIHQRMKEGVSADLIVERVLHPSTLMASSRLLRVSLRRAGVAQW